MAYAPERAATVECYDADGRRARLREGPLGRRRARARQRRGRRGRGRHPPIRTCGSRACSRTRCPTARSCSSRWPATGSTASTTLAPALRALGAGARHACTTSARCRSGASTVSTRSGSRSPPRWSGARGRTARVPRTRCTRRLAGGPPRVASPSTSTATPTSATRSSTAAASALVDLEDAAAGPGRRRPRVRDRGAARARGAGAASGRLLDGYSRHRAGAVRRTALRWHVAASVLARVAVPAVGRIRPGAARRA